MNPFHVSTGTMPVWVMNPQDIGANFSLLATRAAEKTVIRVAGGCSNMSTQDKEEMLRYFQLAFNGFQGMIWSGGTRQISDGQLDPMVTDVPGLVLANNPGCIALGSTPRTGQLALTEQSRLVLDKDGGAPNPTLSGLAIVQKNSDDPMDWDGDLDFYFSTMRRLQEYAGFTAAGLVAWNGGGVTEKEILRSVALGWPTILVVGSGRKTDEIAEKWLNRDASFLATLPEKARICIADRKDPMTLNHHLKAHGFIQAA